jgi:hypothetical protein
MRRLSKEESRQRYAEGRKLWNEFDPIGVAHAVQDEYDNYIGPCLRIVEEGGGPERLEPYLRHIVFEYMGLSQTELGERAIEVFANNFNDWYRKNWPDTVV